MTNWDGYEVIELPLGPTTPRELNRADARRTFHALMDMREARIEQLRLLVERNGYPVDSEQLFRQSVVEFINAHAEAEEAPIDIGFDLGEWASRMRMPLAIWQAVAVDFGVFAGSAMVHDIPTLRWELQTKGGKLHDGYHFPVLKGFEHGLWPDFYISPITLAEQRVGAAATWKPMEPLNTWIEKIRKYA